MQPDKKNSLLFSEKVLSTLSFKQLTPEEFDTILQEKINNEEFKDVKKQLLEKGREKYLDMPLFVLDLSANLAIDAAAAAKIYYEQVIPKGLKDEDVPLSNTFTISDQKDPGDAGVLAHYEDENEMKYTSNDFRGMSWEKVRTLQLLEIQMLIKFDAIVDHVYNFVKSAAIGFCIKRYNESNPSSDQIETIFKEFQEQYDSSSQFWNKTLSRSKDTWRILVAHEIGHVLDFIRCKKHPDKLKRFYDRMNHKNLLKVDEKGYGDQQTERLAITFQNWFRKAFNLITN